MNYKQLAEHSGHRLIVLAVPRGAGTLPILSLFCYTCEKTVLVCDKGHAGARSTRKVL